MDGSAKTSKKKAEVTRSDKANSRTNVFIQRRICDNKRCNPQRRYNSHKTLYNIKQSRQLDETKPPNNARRI